MAEEFRNTSQFFRRFTIPSDPLDAQILRPWLYLVHRVGMQNQFLNYGQPAVLMFARITAFCRLLRIISAETLMASSERNSFSFAKI